MLKHSPIFWIAIFSSLITGLYGLVGNQWIIFVPYVFINPPLLFLITSIKKFTPIKRQLEILGSLIIFTNIPGSVYLHKIGIQYDMVLHFFVAFVAFQAIYFILPLIFNRPRIPRLTAALVTITGGLIFEGFQKLSDTIFGSQLFFDVAQSASLDFSFDILINIFGTAVGVIYLKLTSSQSAPTSQDHA